MSGSIGAKIAKFAHDYRSRLLREQGKTAAKMTKYDVALFMKNEGTLTEAEFNSWVNEREGREALQLTTQQQEALKRGTIFTTGLYYLQSYLDSDEVSDFTLGNVLGFERTTDEKTGVTTIKSKAVSGKNFSVAEEMKKQSFYNYIKSLPTPQATYTELMRSIEFDKLDTRGKMEMMLKISGEKFNEAKEKGDKQAMKEYLLEGIGMSLQLACKKVDDTVGITATKDFLYNRTIYHRLVELVDKLVDDGDDAKLSDYEKNWEGIKGFAQAMADFVGTQGAVFVGVLELLSAGAAGLSALTGSNAFSIGFSVLSKGFFMYQGGSMMVDGYQGFNNAKTKEEAGQYGGEFGMGSFMFFGSLKSLIGDIQTYRASRGVPEGQGGLPELSDGHKVILEENLPAITDNAQVTTDLAFLQSNGVEVVKFTPETGFDLVVNGKSMQLKPNAGEVPTFETGLSEIVRQIKSEIVPPTKPASLTEALTEIKEKIQDFSIPFRLKSKMHDDFHITGNQVDLRLFTEYEAEGLTREQMLHRFFNVEKLSEEQIQQCYKWLDNIAETRAKIDKSFETVIPSLTPETYYRGLVEEADSRVMQIIQNAKVGDVIVPDEGYAWYTPKESYANDFASYVGGDSSPETCVVMKIKTPAGARLSRDINFDLFGDSPLGISGINPYGSMNVVAQRGVRYEVLGKEIKDGKTYITLKYLGPKETVSHLGRSSTEMP